MSSSIALRRSPKPGALTAQHFSTPRTWLTISVARASPSTSGDNQQRPPNLHDLVEQREHVLQRGNLSIADQDEGVLMHRLGLFQIGDEIGRDEPAVELHAFDNLER